MFLHFCIKKRKKGNSNDEKIKNAITLQRKNNHGRSKERQTENIMFQIYLVKYCGRADSKMSGDAALSGVGCGESAVGCRVLDVDCRLLLSFFFFGAQLCHRS